MLDRVQAGAGGEHPAGEDALDLALQRDLVDFDEGVGVRRLGRRPRIADARRHLQRAELHRLVDGDVERDDAAGDLVETGEHRGRIGDALRRRLDHDFVAGLRRGIGRLLRRGRAAALAGRQARQRLHRRAAALLRLLARRRRGATGTPGGGASGCDWMSPAPGRLEGGRLIGAGNGAAGGLIGRAGNCAAAGSDTSAALMAARSAHRPAAAAAIVAKDRAELRERRRRHHGQRSHRKQADR